MRITLYVIHKLLVQLSAFEKSDGEFDLHAYCRLYVNNTNWQIITQTLNTNFIEIPWIRMQMIQWVKM
jgi:hypothetical protein